MSVRLVMLTQRWRKHSLSALGKQVRLHAFFMPFCAFIALYNVELLEMLESWTIRANNETNAEEGGQVRFYTKHDGFHTKTDGFHTKTDGFHSSASWKPQDVDHNSLTVVLVVLRERK